MDKIREIYGNLYIKINCQRCRGEFDYCVPEDARCCWYCKESEKLKKENEKLKEENKSLKSENNHLKENFESNLEEEKAKFDENIRDLLDKSQKQSEMRIEEYKEEILKLKRKLIIEVEKEEAEIELLVENLYIS